MPVPITLTQIDSRRTDFRDVGGNLVITSRGSLAVTNALYALKILDTANQLAATVNGGISLSTNKNTVVALQINALEYSLKVGSFKPALALTLNGLATDATAQGKLISGNALTLGNASDPASFGATLSSTVTANGDMAKAYSYAIVLGDSLTVASRQFSGAVSSSARSAAGLAYAYGIDAKEVVFADLTAAARFNVTATAGSKLDEEDAVAIAITAENGIAAGAFGAAVTVNATAGGGTVNVSHASAAAFGIRSFAGIDLGLFGNTFTVNAKSGKAAGSAAEAAAIAFFEDSTIAGFAAGFRLAATATGVNRASAKGISGNADLLIAGALNGNWSAVANGGDGFPGATGRASAAMIDIDGELEIEKDFNAVFAVRAAGTRGQDGYAAAIEATGGIIIRGQTAGSITSEAKVTGSGTVVRSAAAPQAYSAGFKTLGDAYFYKGFAANFRLNSNAAGIDSAESYGISADNIFGYEGALVGTWTVSATSTGGQNSAGYVGNADAYGIYAKNSGVSFNNNSGSGKLTLTVSASGNTANLTAVTNAVSNAYGIKAGLDIELDELGMLTVSARAGRAALLSSASATGLSGAAVTLDRLSGANITANAASEAWASAIQSSLDITVANVSGAFNVTAVSGSGRAFATGFTASNTNLRGVTSGSSLTVRATGGVGVSNGWTDASATGISGALTVAGTLSTLIVAAASGRGGISNSAAAYGVYADSGNASFATLGTVNISATAVQSAEAFGFYADNVTVNQLNGSWSVTAASAAGGAQAHGVSGNLYCTQAKAAITVRATGGTSAPGGNSSATAIGIRGGVFDALPTLNVTAVSGKNATANNATAYGVESNVLGGSINGLRRINIAANAVDQAEAVGYRNAILSGGFASHVETVNAVSTISSALAIGYRNTIIASELTADLAGTLTVGARGATSAQAVGIDGVEAVRLDSSSSTPQKMTVTAQSAGVAGAATAAAIASPEITMDNGLFANWTVSATAVTGTATASLFSGATGGGRVGGLNGVFAVSATGTFATAAGFDSAGASLDSVNRKQNLSLAVNARASGSLAAAEGIAFDSIDFDSGTFRDTVTVTADGYSAATASGIRSSGVNVLSFLAGSLFALTVTARSTTGTATASGFDNAVGALSLAIAGAVNVSATGGKTTTDTDVSATATGISGGFDFSNSVYVLQTFNVTAKSGSGSGFSDDMDATAMGVNFLDSGNSRFSSFETASQTKMTVKADAAGFASATAVWARNLELYFNAGAINVAAVSTGNRAQAVGASAFKSLQINQGLLKLTVAATGGKTANPLENNNAVAFGLVAAGNLDVDGNLLSSTNAKITSHYSATVLDGILTVSAKASSGANAGAGKAHAAAFAAEDIRIDSFSAAFKANVRAESADKRARAFGIQGNGNPESLARIGFEGVWTVAAVSGSGTAEAYGIGATADIELVSQLSQTKLQVSAEADGIANAYGFSSSETFTSAANLALAVTVTATSRKNGAAEAIGIRTAEATATISGSIAATASGGAGSLAVGIFASGVLRIDGVVAAATAKNGDAYAIRGDLDSGIALDLVINGAVYGGRNGNAAAVANQLAGLVKSGGGAASLLGSINPAATGGAYFAVSGTAEDDSVRLANNAISVGDISLGGGADTLTLGATSQVIGNIGNDVETITFLINSDPGKNPIITVRDSAGALDSQLFATVDNAQLGTYILAQGSSTDIGAMTGVSLEINGGVELLLSDSGSRRLNTGAYGRLSLVTTGKVSKLVLEITYDALGTPPAGGNYLPPDNSSSLSLPDAEVPPAAGSSGLSFEDDFRLYGVGAADLQLGASDSLFEGEQQIDPFKKGLLAG
ncbi:MAG: beta strand repeat-containing protein [Victivallaceae bacterium]